MDRFRKSLSESLLTRLVSYLLVIQLIFPPLWVNKVYAALVTDPHASVSFQPQIDTTSGIPIIDIVAPNNIGLSHNKYQDFDVDHNGLIFNNSLVSGNSRLAGQIVANPLFGGRTASIILNEVTGASDSELKGLMEVFGDKANVIIANPNGITCNGCGFINTQRATLTTGVPEFSTGRFRLDVDGGLIRFEDEGYSYRSFVDEVDVLSQYIDINGDISTTNRISLVAGRFIFDYSKSIAGGKLAEWVEAKENNDQPQDPARTLAIDGTIFGAMQSGQIDIMGTEQGLGVKADGYLFAQADDLFIQSAGGLSINNADAVREIKLSAQDNIVIGADLIANLAIKTNADSLTMDAEANLIASEVQLTAEDSLNLRGDIKAFDITLDSKALTSDADLLAINTLNITTTEKAQFNDSAIASNNAVITSVEAEFDNAELKGTALELTADKTTLLQSTIESTELALNIGEAISEGIEIVADTAVIQYSNWQDQNSDWHIGSLELSGNQLNGQGGSWLFNNGELNVGALNLDNSRIFSYQGIISANNLNTSNSQIYSEKLALTIKETLSSTGDVWRILPFSAETTITDVGAFDITANQADFTNGVIQANDFQLNGDTAQFDNTGIATNTIDIHARELTTDTDTLWLANDNVNIIASSSAKMDHTLKTSDLMLTTANADISGHWLIADNAVIESTAALNIQDLELTANTFNAIFDQGKWDNLLVKTNTSDITANNTLDISKGTIESTQLSLASNQLSLDENTWIGANTSHINADQINNAGVLLASNELQIESRDLHNLGNIASFEQLNITSSESLNNQGSIIANQLVIDSASTINNKSISSETLTLSYQSFENTDNASLVSNDVRYEAKTNTASFTNYGVQIASDSMQWLSNEASSGRYTNAGLLTGSDIQFSGLNQVTNGVLIDGTIQGSIQALAASGEEQAQGRLSIGAEAFTQLGTIEADELSITRDNFHNEGNIYTSDLTANINNEFKNSGILAADSLSLIASGLSNSQGSTISTVELNIEGANVDNSGTLIATNIELTGDETASSYFTNKESGLLIQNAIHSDSVDAAVLGEVSISGFNTFTNSGLIETDGLLSIDNIRSFNNYSEDLVNLDSTTRIVSESGIKLSNIDAFNNSAILVADAISVQSNSFNNSGIVGAGEAVIEVAEGSLMNSGRMYQSDLSANDNVRNQINTAENEFNIEANGLINSETSSIELAKGRIDLKAGDLVNKGLIRELEKDVVTGGLSIANVKNIENHNDLSLSTDLVIVESGSISNLGESSYIKANSIIGSDLRSINNEGALLANTRIDVESENIINANGANIYAEQITFNSTTFINNSNIGSELELEIYSTTLINNALAEIYSTDGRIRLSGHDGITNKGNVLANTDLAIEADLLINEGVLNAQNNIAINQSSTGAIENDGYVFAETVSIGNESHRQLKVSNTASNSEGPDGEIILAGIQSGEGGLDIITQELANQGQISSDNNLLINTTGSMTGNNALTGSLEAKGRLTLSASGLEVANSAKIVALGDENSITIINDFNNAGLVSLNNNSSINSGNLNNSATLSGNTLGINVVGDLSNSAVTSQVYADHLNVVTNNLNNQGLIQANTALEISAANDAVNTHEILALETLVINGGENNAASSLSNSGTISSKAINVAAASLNNNADATITAETAEITATTISNAGTLYQLESDTANAAFNITAEKFTNAESNAIVDVSNGLFNLNTLTNQGLIRERQDSALDPESDSDQLRLTNVKTLNNSGELILYSDLTLTDTRLNNNGDNAYIRANSLTAQKLTDFSNSGKIATQNVLSLNSENALANQGELVANQFIANTAQEFTNQGLVQATTQLEISAQNISNEAGAEISKIGTDTNLELSAIGRINNAGNIASKSGLNVNADDILNSQNISSSKTTTLLANSLNNTGLIYGHDLNIGSNEKFITQTRDEIRPETDIDTEADAGGLVAANTLNLYTNGLMNDVYRASIINITSNADLILAGDITAEKQTRVIAENLTLNKTASIYTGDGEDTSTFSITQTLKNEGDISSKSTLLINATDINNIGEIKTSKELAINANTINTAVDSLISAADTLHISGSGTGNNDQAISLITNGDIVSDKSLSLQSELITNNGNIQATGNLDIAAQTLSNTNKIQSNQQLNIVANNVTNGISAQLSSIESLTINGPENGPENGIDNRTADTLINSGTISSATLSLAATTLSNNAGAIIAAETADLTATTVSNAGSLYQLDSDTENSAFNITAHTLDNNNANATIDIKNGLVNLNTLINQGFIRERQENAADSDQLLLTNIKTLNNSGELILYSDLALTDASLTNTGEGAYIRANSLTANNLTEFSNSGKIAAQNLLSISSEETLNNQGELVANQFTAVTQQDFINQGLIQGNTQLDINANSISNLADAEISKLGTASDLKLTATGQLNNAGNIASKGGLNVSADELLNSQNLTSSGTTTVSTNALNNSGLIYGNNLTVGSHSQYVIQTRDGLRTEAEANAGGLVAANTLTLYTQGLMNDVYRAEKINIESNTGLQLAGKIEAEKQANISAKNLTVNNTSAIYIGESDEVSTLSITNGLENNGDITSNSALSLIAKDVINNAEIKTNKQLEIHTNTLTNTVDALISAAEEISFSGSNETNLDQATSLINQGEIVSDKTLSIRSNLITNSGNLQALENIDITAQTLTNAKNIQSNKQLNIIANNITNQAPAQLSSIEALTINAKDNNLADTLINSGIISSKDLSLAATTLTNNTGAIIAAEKAGLTATTINNIGTLYQLESETPNAAFNITAHSLSNTGTSAKVDVRNGLFNLNTLINQGLIRERQENAADSDQLLLTNINTLNNSGELILYSDLELTDTSLTNNGANAYIRANSLIADNPSEFSNSGKIAALHLLSLSSEETLSNQGELVADQFTVSTQQDFTNQGLIQANTQLDINANSISNLADAEISKLGTASDLKLTATGQLNNAGNIASIGGLNVSANELLNSQNLTSSGTTTVSTNTLNNSGLIYGNNLTVGSNSQYVTETRDGLRTESEANAGGLVAANTLTLYTQGLMNDVYRASNINLASNVDLTLEGSIVASNKLDIVSKALTLNGGINIGDSVDISTWNVTGQFSNKGKIDTASNLVLNAETFTNNSDIKAKKDLTINSDSITNELNSVLSSQGRLTISGVGESLTDRSIDFTNNGKITADQGFDLSVNTITNNNNIKASGNSQWYFSNLTNNQGKRITVDGIWSMGSVLDPAGDINNLGKLYASSFDIKTNGSLNNHNLAQFVSYGGDLRYLGTINSDIVNEGGFFVSGKVNVAGNSLTNTGNIEIFAKDTLNSLVVGNSTISLIENFQNGVSQGEIQDNGVFKSRSSIKIEAEKLNNQSAINMDSPVHQYEGIYTYDFKHDGRGGKTDKLMHFLSYQYGEYRESIQSTFDVVGDLTVDATSFNNIGSSINVTDTLNIENTSLLNESKKDKGTLVGLKWGVATNNNGKKKAGWALENDYRSNDKATKNEAIKHILDRVAKKGDTYIWADAFQKGEDRTPEKITQEAKAFDFVNPTGVSIIKAGAIVGDKKDNKIDESGEVIFGPEKKKEDLEVAADVIVLTGNNSDRTLITNGNGVVDDSSGVDNVNQPTGADLKSETLLNQGVTTSHTANYTANSGAADDSSGVSNVHQPKGTDLTSELIDAQLIDTNDKTNTKNNTGATSGKDRYIKHSRPTGELLSSEAIADYTSTIKDLTSARNNVGATQGSDAIVNAEAETIRKEQEDQNIATGSATNTEDLDETSDHVKGSFINGADGLVIQVANRQPTASISLLSFIIPGLSFDALSAASVAGDKTAEEIAAQAALQAQLDLLESDKDKNSDTIKGQSNSYNAQAPSLFDLDEDILQRIIADTEYELSPEYIFDKVDPDKILDTEPKFFLDPYQEAQAVTQAALQQTGTAFFSPDWNTSAEQRQGLYDNTLVYLDHQQDVTLGQALTPMQVKQLEKPMIWYVSMNIGGQSQLVPTVYLPEATLAQITTPSAGTIIADSMDINVGDFKNTGDIQVANSARIQADVLTNQRNVMTFGDDVNFGAIAGSGGNISAGNLALISATDIHNNGGSLTGTESLVLDAQNDINLNALELSSRTQNGSSISESTNHILSQINAGNLSFSAGGDLNSQAAQIQATGNAAIDVGGDINLDGVENRTYSQVTSTKKSTFSKSKKTVENESIDFVGSLIDVEGDLAMTSGGDVNLTGSQANASGNVSVDATGDINIVSAIDSTMTSTKKSGSNIASASTHDFGSYTETAEVAGISGNNVELNSSGSITLAGAELNAEETLTIGDSDIQRDEAGNPILDENGHYIAVDGTKVQGLNITTLELKEETWNDKTSGLKGPLKDLVKSAVMVVGSTKGLITGDDSAEIQTGEGSSTRTNTTTQQGSTVDAKNLELYVDGDTNIIGSDVTVTENAVIQTASLTLDAAKETSTTEESSYTESASNVESNLEEDEFVVGGLETNKTTSTTTTHETSWNDSSLTIGNNLTVNATGDVNLIASAVEVTGEADISAENINIGGREATTETTTHTKVETETLAIGVKNAYADTALAIKAVADAAAALEDAKEDLDDAKRNVRNGTLAASALDDYKANLAAATAQLTQAGIAAVAAGATAAATTGTGGFYVSGSAEKSVTETTTTNTSSTFNGSSINLGSGKLNADNKIEVTGSAINVVDNLEINADDIIVKAGIEETTETSSETTRTAGATASYGASGASGGVNASGSNTDSESYSKTHINSSINAGSLNSTSDNLTLSGANVEVAGNIDIDTGNLTIESLQDESSSSSKTEGYNASVSKGGDVSGGANQNSSNSDSRWVNNQTTLIGGTGGEGDVNINADSTTITGATVASATRNEDGSLTDNSSSGTGSLNLATDELVINNLEDKDHSESEGFDVSGSSGSTTVGLTSNGHKTDQDTLATLGGGNITQKDGSEHEESVTENVNSDLNNSQVITKDQQTGGLDATVTVDHRLLTEEGREDIADDFEASAELAVEVGEAAIDGADFIADEIAVLGDDLPEELQEKLGETGERFVDELIREDLSDDQIVDILARENIQDGLEGVELADQQLSDDPSLAERNPDESPLPESSSAIVPTGDELALETVIITADDPSALEVGAAGLGKVQQELDTLHEENADLALGVEVAIGVATGGPLKEGISQAINHGIEQIAGEEMADLETAMNNYAGGYVTDEGRESFADDVTEERQDPYDNAELGTSAVDISDGLRMATGTILGIGSGRGGSSSPNRSGEVDTNIEIGGQINIADSGSVLNSGGFEVPDTVVRRDDDFNNPNRTHFDENGNLNSANPGGDLSTVSHVRGSQGSDSQHISTSSLEDAGPNGPKLYGDKEISIDTRRLQEDINAGHVEGVEIRTPLEVQADLRINVNQAQERYNDNPSIRNERRLDAAQQDLSHSCRDGECLISPKVPSEYISQPKPMVNK